MGNFSDIIFTLGETKYSLTPMKQKVAAHVFHKCLGRVLTAVAGAVVGDSNEERMASFAKAIAATDFEDVWFILEHMMKHAQVNGEEVKDLEDSDIFDENPHHMYLVIYHGIKGNWPGYFSKMEAKMSGFTSMLKDTMGKMGQTPTA